MLSREDFEEVFTTHYQSLWLYARRFVIDMDIAEDIVQEVFYNLWKIRKDLQLNDSVKAYLFSGVYNKCVNYIKHEKIKNKHKEEVINSIDHFNNFYFTEIIKKESSILKDDSNGTIKKAINNLPDQCRRIFLLSRKYNLKNREIADFLDISQKVVEKQISKALISLREQLRNINT